MQLKNFKFDQNLTRKNGSLHEDRHMYIYDISLKSPYDKTFLDINYRENQNTFCVQ